MIFEWLTRYPDFKLREESAYRCKLLVEAIKTRRDSGQPPR